MTKGLRLFINAAASLAGATCTIGAGIAFFKGSYDQTTALLAGAILMRMMIYD